MIRTIGIMTGNSLDAVDTVITEFEGSSIKDICSFSVDIPQELADSFRSFKSLIAKNDGDIEKSIKSFDFQTLHNNYINLIALSVKEVINKCGIKAQDIDAIGFHGQTCAHCPPSITKGDTYTLQIGSGQMLADLTGIPVVFDFRSDDLMNGGEGAPLAPIHNLHIAQNLREKGIFPVAFCNAGNTGNISIISQDAKGKEVILGFDVGPCNHFIDYLSRTEKGQACDFDGKFGFNGKVNDKLFKALFEKSVTTKNGENYLTLPPPKSSDPAWYKAVPELRSKKISFEDRIRTVEYFSAYLFAYSLDFIRLGSKLDFSVQMEGDPKRRSAAYSDVREHSSIGSDRAVVQKKQFRAKSIKDVELPKHFLIFGGGWQNPIVLEHFKQLIQEKIKDTVIEWSDVHGYSGKYMEARIFADMAKCKLMNEPFTLPEITGCNKPTICGIIAKPGEKNQQLWSRAAKGWNKPNLTSL